MDKRQYDILGYDANNRPDRKPFPVWAASPDQALNIALGMRDKASFVKFGLVGDDKRCHVFIKRNTGAVTWSATGNGVMAEAFQKASGAPSATTAAPPSKSAAATAQELADFILRSILPQISSLESFTAHRLGSLLPDAHRAKWTPAVWASVLTRLRASKAIYKKSHFQYARAAELPSPPPRKEATTPAQEPHSANGTNGNGHANGANGHHASPPVVTPEVPPPPSPVQRIELSPDERIDSVLLMMKMLVTDDRAKQEKFNAMADRLMNVATELDTIRSELAAMVQGEVKAPERMAEVLMAMKGRPAAVPLAS